MPQHTGLSLRLQVARYMGVGIEQLGRSFGSNYLKFSTKVAGGCAYSR